MTEHIREKLFAANDVDAALEESLTTVWDAKVYTWDNSKYPFNEWFLKRILGMGYKLDDLSDLHEAVPLNETYSADDFKTIRKYLEFSKYGKSRLPIGLPLTAASKLYFEQWAGSLAQYG